MESETLAQRITEAYIDVSFCHLMNITRHSKNQISKSKKSDFELLIERVFEIVACRNLLQHNIPRSARFERHQLDLLQILVIIIQLLRHLAEGN